jgi:branched-subunit amino acid transport protein
VIWLVILGVAIGSYALRSLPLFAVGRLAPSERVERALERAGAAALMALATTTVADAGAGWAPAPILALAAGAVAAVRGASLARVLAVGVVVYLIVDLAI